MGKESLILRDTINPPLTTKGSALTFAEMDSNVVETYNALVELSQSSNVPAYDNTKNYYLNDYTQEGSQLYRCIVAGAIVNIDPPSNPASWLPVYAADMIQIPKRYVEWEAVLNQAGTAAPAGNVGVDELDNAVVASYDSVGKYVLTKAGSFPGSGKTTVSISNGATINGLTTIPWVRCKLSASRDVDGTIAIISIDSTDGTFIDDGMINATVRIRVYS